MPPATVAHPWTVTLGGIELTVVPDPAGKAIDAGYSGAYETQESTRAFARRDVPLYLSSFKRGAGFVEMVDPSNDGGLAWAEDGYTHLGNGLRPSGLRVAKGAGLGLLVSGVTATDLAITDSRQFNGHLWCITSGGCVIRLPGTDPNGVPVFDPALNSGAWANPTTSLRAGYVCKAIEVFGTTITGGVYAAGGTPTPALYVSAYNSATGATRIYQYTVAGGWTESAVLGFRADRMTVVWWEGRDGVGAQRLVIQTDDVTIRHCIYGSDPMAAGSYVTPIVVCPGYSITRLEAAPTHLFVGTTAGWYDVSEIRAAPLTPYYKALPSVNNCALSTIYEDGLIGTRGFGLDRLDLNLGAMVQQRRPGECGPGFRWQDGTPIFGQISGLAQHDGALLMSLWNSANLTSYAGRAYDRHSVNVEVENPLVHYWAEQVIKPTAGIGQQVTHMAVVAPSVSSALLSDRTVYQLLFTADNPTNLGFNFNLYYAPLPTGSGSLSIQASAGSFTHNTPARFFFTAQNWGDRNALKVVRRYDIASAETNGTATIELRARADGAAATRADTSTYTSQGLHNTTANTKSMIPATVTSGNSIELLAILSTVSPYQGAPVLKEVSPRAAIRREVFKTRSIWIVLEKDHELASGAVDLRDPDTVFAAVSALQTAGYQAFVNETGGSETVLVEQGVQFARGDDGTGQWKTLARFELSTVA